MSVILIVLIGPDQGKRFVLPDNEPQQIGRSGESLPLTDQTISRRHAELTPDEGKWYIADLESANGTYVNGEKVIGRRLLHAGDQIRTGNSVFVYGKEVVPARSNAVRLAPSREVDTHVEARVASNDDSMVMAVPEPSSAAVFQLKVIYELTQLIGTIGNRQQLLERVMGVVFDFFQADRGFILLQDESVGRLEPFVVRHRIEPQANPRTSKTITVSKTIVNHVLREGEGILSSNAQADRRFAAGESVAKYGIRSALCVPIKFKDRVFGVIYLDSKIANYTYTEDQLRLLTAVGVQVGLALNNEEQYAQRAARERLAVAGQTVASLSHSVKNIIQGLRGGAEVVELGLRKEALPTIRGGWDIVSRNLERISQLTMNMLAFSKQRKPELEMTNLPTLLEDIQALMQRQYDIKKVAMIAEIDATMPPVPVDPTGIHQALLNLLNNALEAVEPDTGAVTLRCHYDDAVGVVRLSVADNGEGLEPAARQNLFQPFHSTKGQRGTGLGLAVTKKIVDEHNGKISVESEPGAGTIFTIELPTQFNDALGSTETLGPSESQE